MTRPANPFDGLTVEQIYARLMDRARSDLPHWPGVEAQKQYTGGSGPFIVRRGLDFIGILEADGAFKPGWKGLDYGCGWGRLASLLLAHGGADQLDLCDAWSKSIDLIREGGFPNRVWTVSEMLADEEIPSNRYDFIYACSVFTHLAPAAFWNNIDQLMQGLRPDGRLYITVRHSEFIASRFTDRSAQITSVLDARGFWFESTRGDLGQRGVFGEMIVTQEYLSDNLRRGKIRYVGAPANQFQHVYALSR